MQLIASNQLVVIVGLGVTGVSAARFLQKQNVNFIVMDSRDAPPNYEAFIREFPEIKVLTGALDASVLASASEMVVSPGISLKTPEIAAAIDQGVTAIGDIELFARYVDKPVVAITGSNAKSTVTTLVGEMVEQAGLSVAVGGNIGVPVLELLDREAVDIFVLELSSFQLETTHSLRPKVATILNISHDHMDRYSDLSEYHQAKQRIYRHAEQVVVNRQDPLTHPPLSRDALVWTFGVDQPDIKGFGLRQKQGVDYLAYQFSTVLPVSELPIKGKHNAVNAAAALALGMAIDLPLESMVNTLRRFSGLAHRCQYVATINDVMYINDSKATNVGATLAAIEGFAPVSAATQKIILIAGGDGKGADFSPLYQAILEHVKHVVLIGRDSELIQKAIAPETSSIQVSTLQEAVDKAYEIACEGDVVLLSPACASFDMFAGFEDRGQQFMQLVEALAA